MSNSNAQLNPNRYSTEKSGQILDKEVRQFSNLIDLITNLDGNLNLFNDYSSR